MKQTVLYTHLIYFGVYCTPNAGCQAITTILIEGDEPVHYDVSNPVKVLREVKTAKVPEERLNKK